MSRNRIAILASALLMLLSINANAQVQTQPNIVYGNHSEKYVIGGIKVEGVKNYED